MDEKIQERYENFLNPFILRKRLIIGSLYLAAFEILTTSIISRIKDFYTRFDTVDPRYMSEVLAREGSLLYSPVGAVPQNEFDQDRCHCHLLTRAIIISGQQSRFLIDGMPRVGKIIAGKRTPRNLIGWRYPR